MEIFFIVLAIIGFYLLVFLTTLPGFVWVVIALAIPLIARTMKESPNQLLPIPSSIVILGWILISMIAAFFLIGAMLAYTDGHQQIMLYILHNVMVLTSHLSVGLGYLYFKYVRSKSKQ